MITQHEALTRFKAIESLLKSIQFSEDEYELTFDGHYKAQLMSDAMDLNEQIATWKNEAYVEDKLNIFEDECRLLVNSRKNKTRYNYLTYITGDSFWIQKAIEGKHKQTFITLQNQFYSFAPKDPNLCYSTNRFKERYKEAAGKALDEGFVVRTVLRQIAEDKDRLLVELQNDNEYDAIIFSIALGLEVQRFTIEADILKNDYVKKLKSYGLNKEANILLEANGQAALLGLIGYDIFRIIDISCESGWSWENVPRSLVDQLEKAKYSFDTDKLPKLMMTNTRKYRGLQLFQAIALQLLKMEVISSIAVNDKVDNPKEYKYASALYYDEDLSSFNKLQMQRLDILALESIPFDKAKTLALNAARYYSWRYTDAKLTENREFIQELEDLYGDSLYVQ